MRPVRFQLRLTHKVAAIGCVGVVGLAAVGLIYQQGTWSQDSARKVAEDARAISGLTKRISIEMLETRRDEKNFLLRKQDSYVKHHAQLSGAIGRDFDELKTMVKAAGYADLSDKIGVIHDGFESYGNDFAVLALVQAKIGLNETTGLTGSLRKAVDIIEAGVNQINDPKLTSRLLAMRRHEKDFMLWRDDKYADEFKKAVVAFSLVLMEMDLPYEVQEKISLNLNRYSHDFADWVGGAQDVARAEADIMKTFSGFEPLVVEALKEIDRLAGMADASEMALRDAMKMRMVAALALAALMMCALSLLLGRAISQPISAMTSALTKLASGDFNVVLPGLHRHDEIGEMAGAARIFKDNMIETERLRGRTACRPAGSVAAAQGRAVAAGFRLPGRRRLDRRQALFRGDRTRSRGFDADQDRGDDAGIVRRGGRGLQRGLRQHSIGGRGDRTDDLVGRGNRPAGVGIQQHRTVRRRTCEDAPTPASPRCRRRPAGSAMSSNSSPALPSRPICWP